MTIADQDFGSRRQRGDGRRGPAHAKTSPRWPDAGPRAYQDAEPPAYQADHYQNEYYQPEYQQWSDLPDYTGRTGQPAYQDQYPGWAGQPAPQPDYPEWAGQPAPQPDYPEWTRPPAYPDQYGDPRWTRMPAPP